VDIGDWLIYGRPIVATRSGIITFAGYAGDAGLMVENDLGTDWGISRDCHMSGVAVGIGQRVAQGQVIGYVGNTGNSTGPHCHHDLRFRTRELAERVAQGSPVYWDDDPAGFNVDPQVAWQFKEQEDDVRHVFLMQTTAPNKTFVWHPEDDKAVHITPAGYRAIEQAQKEGKITFSVTPVSHQDIEAIGIKP
jgi:murein DD-endopeptidase MepM/ murein hydrolase activator NlpD